MRCFCSSTVNDCPENRQKQCDSRTSHCLLLLTWDGDSNRFIETFQDCWHWTDRFGCPREPGPCHIFQETEKKFKACCCKGDLCNNVSDNEFASPFKSNTSDYLATEPPFNLSKAYSIGKPNPFGSNITPIGLVVSIVVPVIALLFLILLAFLIVHFFCHRLRRSFKWKPVSRPVYMSSLSTAFQYFGSLRSKRYCECQTVKLTSSTTAPNCTCGLANKSANELEQLNGLGDTRKRSTVGFGWSIKSEIEGLANVVTKIQLKSQGCFGQVWHGRLTQKLPTTNSSDEPLPLETDVAIKIFRPAQKESWETELTLFRIPGLAHPNILKFYGADQTTVNYAGSPEVELWLVTEYHPLGSLHDYLKSYTISWTELLQIAVGIARGLSHLHSESSGSGLLDSGGLTDRPKPSIAHRDLNSRNVLLKTDMTACIADFGLAIRLEPGHFPSITHHPQLGTRRYMAPEVLDGAIQFSRDAYLRIDVYAMGLILWELMSRCCGMVDSPLAVTSPYRVPFELELGPNPAIEELQRFVALEKQRPKFHPSWNGSLSMCTLWETVEECWDQDAEARLSAGCVAERLAALSRQPWSRYRLTGPSDLLPLHSYPQFTAVSFSPSGTSGQPTLMASRTVPVIQTPCRSANTGPISFPIPSTSVPIPANGLLPNGLPDDEMSSSYTANP
ncbi:Receptor protein serine/threonine kinase [Paragonimus heterotremus]|uniref:receptor protein serine/threonine kinase n=1 Tax=Paragonimus heterotremus TaxID=100268 RepID=A0A8J4TDU8_9TREM|nr:Receptor protein serine/threonine kinase [Paragonimus heterotremus]